ncbi:GspH/FimT family pseudopilin [Telluria mixta]|uniref:Type II secretion system protein H n=1 Tax=Telluria mixta TaxID=34071 RepID=A0ABT2C6S8_9BURK|nr:GspH/FimT family pseudopilin [Telluria mixta]MCS0633072.1 GspH/FimT family pseudopilin [Telluria mixta]WEM96113.1 GspH/FimT family pseudopilin [Telluria mixta]
MHSRPRRADGVTLPELCIVLAVSAIVLGIAVPDLRDLVRAQQLKAATGDLFAAIDLARAQALARGRRVKVVPRDPLGADWRMGWQVFDDRDGDGHPGMDELIAEHGPLAPGIAVDFAFTNVARPYYIAYNGAGRSCADGNSAAARWGTVSLFHGGHIRRIKINMLGRARVCDPARDGGCDGAPAPP